MKLYYVEHTVLTTGKFALIAKDEEDLKKVLAEREAELRKASFEHKFERDKQGKVVSYELGEQWGTERNPHIVKWTGKL